VRAVIEADAEDLLRSGHTRSEHRGVDGAGRLPVAGTLGERVQLAEACDGAHRVGELVVARERREVVGALAVAEHGAA
jgi:hypothetical protein